MNNNGNSNNTYHEDVSRSVPHFIDYKMATMPCRDTARDIKNRSRTDACEARGHDKKKRSSHKFDNSGQQKSDARSNRDKSGGGNEPKDNEQEEIPTQSFA